jgi:GT2 family glycosyltransferase
MKQPKILVGCPTSYHKEYCLKEYSLAVKSLTYKNKHILLVDNSKDNIYYNKIKEHGLNVIKGPYFESARDRIVASRNILRQYCLDNSFDYFLSLEQDVIPPPNIIEQLLKHSKRVITAIYFARNTMPTGEAKLIPLAYSLLDEKTLSMRPLNKQELWENQGLFRVISCGLGCILIHSSILKEVEFRYDLNTFDDRWFCIDLYTRKIPLYADTSIKCKHLILNRPYPWSKIQK